MLLLLLARLLSSSLSTSSLLLLPELTLSLLFSDQPLSDLFWFLFWPVFAPFWIILALGWLLLASLVIVSFVANEFATTLDLLSVAKLRNLANELITAAATGFEPRVSLNSIPFGPRGEFSTNSGGGWWRLNGWKTNDCGVFSCECCWFLWWKPLWLFELLPLMWIEFVLATSMLIAHATIPASRWWSVDSWQLTGRLIRSSLILILILILLLISFLNSNYTLYLPIIAAKAGKRRQIERYIFHFLCLLRNLEPAFAAALIFATVSSCLATFS